jgi:putative addiction module component (TIGR02574 family)
MVSTLDSLVEQAIELPVALREIMVHRLMVSMDEDYEPEVDPDIKAAWDIELRRRMADFESGKDQGIPAEEVFAEMRKKYPDVWE